VSPAILDKIRAACAEVTRRARLVSIDHDALAQLAAALDRDPPTSAYPDAYHRGDEETTCRFVVILESINFGSGWHPVLRKRPGLSGHQTMAAGLTDLARPGDLWTADELQQLTAEECARVFGQPTAGEPFVLMRHFARALNDLGRLLVDEHDGDARALIAEADRSAERLVLLLDRMPLFRDVARYDELVVPFSKRAQLCSATLSLAFDGHGLGRFDDLDRLTMFADNLVPHVLWCEGVLRFDPDLERRIAAGELLPAGGREDVELRAVALTAVERLAGAVGGSAGAVGHATAMTIDNELWERGHQPRIKAHPRPRVRTTAY
jgi:putative queuosine salvage protein